MTGRVAVIGRVAAAARSAARFLVAAELAAGLTLILWYRVPHRLFIRTGVVGSVIYDGYPYQRLQAAFYLIALVFPALALACHIGLGWLTPHRRDPARRPWWPLRTAAQVGGDRAAAVATPLPLPLSALAEPGPALGPAALLGAMVRVSVAAAVTALEVATLSSPKSAAGWALAAGLGYVAVTVVLAVGLHVTTPPRRRRALRVLRSRALGGRRPPPLVERLAEVNSLLALGAIPLLFADSQSTHVTVASLRRVVHFQWLPWWLAGPLVLAASVIWWRAIRADPAATGRPASVREFAERMDAAAARARRAEVRVLTWVSGPVAVFLLTTSVPGALGRYQAFDDSQFLAGAQMLLHNGVVPWRDVYLLHGLVEDVGQGALGFLIFGDTRWGGVAGIATVLVPLQWVVLYAFAAVFCRRNRWLLAILVGAIGAHLLPPGNSRFIVLPLYLLALHAVLRWREWWSCTLFALAMFVGAVVTPEDALFVVCSYAVLAAAEFSSYQRGRPLGRTMWRTVRCAGVGVALLAAWLAFLASIGAAGRFVTFYSAFGSNHALWGAHPASWSLSGRPQITFEFWAPVALWLAAAFWAAAKLHRRRLWLPRDWVLLAAAAYAVVYYPKALARADEIHVIEVFTATLPLLVLGGIELFSWLDGLARSLVAWERSRTGVRWALRPHLVTPAIAVTIAVVGTGTSFSLASTLRQAPGRLAPSVPDPAPAAQPMLGYTAPGAVDAAEIAGLGRVLDRYGGRRSPVFDYANMPGIVDYLLNRVPGTRFYPINVAQTPAAQRQTIADLERSRPPVVVFSSQDFGLLDYDHIPESVRTYLVTGWLLRHYRPVTHYRGNLILARNDLISGPDAAAGTPLYFAGPTCTMGQIPSYIADPAGGRRAAGVEATVSALPAERSVSGWAVDGEGRAGTDVVAASGGVVVARTTSVLPRPDVAALRHDQDARDSGYTLEVPASGGPYVIWDILGDGTAMALPLQPKVAEVVTLPPVGQKTVTLDGVAYRVVAGDPRGDVEADGPSRAVYQATFPAGTRLSEHFWLEVRTAAAQPERFSVSDRASSGPSHAITYTTNRRSPTDQYVMVGSCLAWYGYDPGGGLQIEVDGPAPSDLRVRLK